MFLVFDLFVQNFYNFFMVVWFYRLWLMVQFLSLLPIGEKLPPWEKQNFTLTIIIKVHKILVTCVCINVSHTKRDISAASVLLEYIYIHILRTIISLSLKSLHDYGPYQWLLEVSQVDRTTGGWNLFDFLSDKVRFSYIT